MSTESRLRNVLTIAGSDPSGGAGLQGDLKTFSALGVYGTNVITAVIAQNTCGVASVYPVSPQAIREQLEHLLSDVTIDAVKIGMVASHDVAEVIADVLRQQRPRWIVLDPVMVAKSGDVLVDDAGIQAVRDVLSWSDPEAVLLIGVVLLLPLLPLLPLPLPFPLPPRPLSAPPVRLLFSRVPLPFSRPLSSSCSTYFGQTRNALLQERKILPTLPRIRTTGNSQTWPRTALGPVRSPNRSFSNKEPHVLI